MSQPIFDPLDAAVLTHALVPWTAGIIAAEAAARQDELMHRTTDEVWRWSGISDANDLTVLAREARREYVVDAVRRWLSTVAAAIARLLAPRQAAKLVHGG